MNPKTDRLSHRKKEEKKSCEGRRYAQISVDSVNTAADTIGISNISEEASKRLADDVSYRLREIIHKCGVYVRHSNRSKLTASDVNCVLQLSDAPRCYGSTDSLKFTYVKEARVFVAEDEEVDLISTALRSEVYLQKDECYIKGTWVFPDKVSNEKNDSKSDDVHHSKAQECIEVLPHHIEYYKLIGKSLLGKSKKLLRMALSDLKSNPKISPVAPMVVNLIAAYIHHHKCHGVKIYDLLLAIDSLIENRSIDMRASDASNTLVTSLLLFAINPLPIHGKSILDDEYLRKFASWMIVKVLKHWHPLEVVLYVELYYNLAGTLLNPQNALLSHLGALHAMINFGNEALDKCLWPNLLEYFTILEGAEKSDLICNIKGAILAAAEKLFMKNVNSANTRETVVFKCDLELQAYLYDYFGDSICAHRRWCGTPGNILDYTHKRKCDSESGKATTGLSEHTQQHTLNKFRCLPVATGSYARYSVDDFFGCVDDNGEDSTVSEAAGKVWVPKRLRACKLRFPRRLFECHTSYSKVRYISKIRRQWVPARFRNTSGNILVPL